MNDLRRRSATQSTNAVEVSGVLETLAAGLSLVIARPYLFLLPLLVDLWTWLGVQIRADALISSMQALLIEQGGRNGSLVAAEMDGVAERVRVNDAAAALTPSVFAGLPADSLLNIILTVLAPAMTAGVNRTTMYSEWSNGLGSTIAPGNSIGVIGLGLLLFLGATVLLALFKVPLAQAVRGGAVSPGTFARDVVAGWVRFLGLLGILAGGLILIGIPLLILAQLMLLAGINLIALITLALFIVGTMAALYTYFLLDAMFIYRVGAIRAARMSYAVARAHLGQSWRFVSTSLLIATGLLQVWDVLAENPPGLVFALVANAVIGTSLSIASMMFFHDRARLPRPATPSTSFTSPRGFPPRSS